MLNLPYMNFLEYLKTSAEEINQELEKFFQNWSKEVEAVSPKLIVLNNAFIRANEGGKRLRGALVKLGYEMIGGENREILKPAAAFEVFQTAILAHDDVIDLGDLRRGKPTLYKALGGNHYGISQTICLGDIGFFLANKLIADSNFPDDKKNQAFSVFSQMAINTALGEMFDIELPHQQTEELEGDVLTIQKLKSADYTVTFPLLVGITLAGDEGRLTKEIKEVGKNLGTAYQIQDDILGIFGDEKSLGKSVTSDAEEGKSTLLLAYVLEHGSFGQRETLELLYGKGKVEERDLEEIRRVFKESGALKYSQQKAAELVKSAKKVIEEMEISREYKGLFSEMADFLVQRSH